MIFNKDRARQKMSDQSRREFLGRTSASALLAGAALHPSIARALSIAADRRTGTIKDVDHVVILMQENRSFDHYYGTLRGVRGFSDPHPAKLSGERLVWEQKDKQGRSILPFHLDTEKTAALKIHSLPHSWQDATGASDGGRWDGWIPWKSELTMGHYRREDIPFQFALAEAFTICDAYHCPIQGQTNPNRLFIWAGGNDPRGLGGGPIVENSSGAALDQELVLTPDTLETIKLMHLDPSVFVNYGHGPRYRYTTYPERLEAAGISWKVYQDPKDNFDGLTNPAVAFQVYNDAKPGEPLHDKAMARWTLDDLRADAMAGRLPQVSWIASSQSDSEHPAGSSPIEGANFTARVLDALTANPAVWARTVLFLTFDENDGFFDHVLPPVPPGFNANGSRAGASTVDTTDDIHSDKLPYGLSVRVPMTVISPWSTGGWVNSQVFDHTSVIRFLETRFGVQEPNITAWRRAVCGDLTSAFDFSKSQDRRVVLPDTGDAKAQVAAALKLPRPAPPAAGAMPVQEPGTRPSRALPYAPMLEEVWSKAGDLLTLRFGNAGRTGLVYRVDDVADLKAVPRHYTVEPGKTLDGDWSVEQNYHLEIRGPNQWYRELRGRADAGLAIQFVRRGDQVVLKFTNRHGAPLQVRCRDMLGNAGEKNLLVPAAGTEWSVPVAGTGNWYDVTVEGGEGVSFFRRLSGRIENGHDTISRPASRSV
jgi:phospholipase C